MKFRVVVHTTEEGGFWAEIPALAGCVSEGETLAETLVNIREAAEGWLEIARERIEHDEAEQESETELVMLNHEVQDHNFGNSHGIDCCMASGSLGTTRPNNRGLASIPLN